MISRERESGAIDRAPLARDDEIRSDRIEIGGGGRVSSFISYPARAGLFALSSPVKFLIVTHSPGICQEQRCSRLVDLLSIIHILP